MNDSTRRHFFRIVAPAVAMPMLTPPPLALEHSEEERLVTQDEIMEAFQFYDRMELSAEDLNLRYQLLIEMLFETNPSKLREKLQVLRDKRKERSVLVDVNTGQTAPFDPSMYDELGNMKMPVPREPQNIRGTPTGPKLKDRVRRRLAKALRKQVIGV